MFKEWNGLPAEELISILIAFLVIVAGIFNLSCFKDIKFSWSDWAGFVFKRKAPPSLMTVEQQAPPPPAPPPPSSDSAYSSNQSPEPSDQKTASNIFFNGTAALESLSPEEQQQAPRESANGFSVDAVHFRPTAVPKRPVVSNSQLPQFSGPHLPPPLSSQTGDASLTVANGNLHLSPTSEPVPVPRIPPRDSTSNAAIFSPQNSLVLEGSDTRIEFDGLRREADAGADSASSRDLERQKREQQAGGGASFFESIGHAVVSHLHFTHLPSVAHERLIEEEDTDEQRDQLVLSSSLRASNLGTFSVTDRETGGTANQKQATSGRDSSIPLSFPVPLQTAQSSLRSSQSAVPSGAQTNIETPNRLLKRDAENMRI